MGQRIASLLKFANKPYGFASLEFANKPYGFASRFAFDP